MAPSGDGHHVNHNNNYGERSSVLVVKVFLVYCTPHDSPQVSVLRSSRSSTTTTEYLVLVVYYSVLAPLPPGGGEELVSNHFRNMPWRAVTKGKRAMEPKKIRLLAIPPSHHKPSASLNAALPFLSVSHIVKPFRLIKHIPTQVLALMSRAPTRTHDIIGSSLPLPLPLL